MEKKIVFRLNDNGLGPELLQNVFLERGYIEYDQEEHGEEGWNLWWKTCRFRTSEYKGLRGWQWINHYPACTSITKKDCLCRNMRKMRVVHGWQMFNFCPVAFNMPNDYTKFVSEYAGQARGRGEESKPLKLWICKPAESSRGRGIFIFKELADLQYDCNAVVQQYITNPLLIGGYKFDIRVYVCVASFHPLQVYVHQEGLVRFSTAKYDLDRTDNIFAHLTNTSINKFSPGYETDKEQVGQGCKWTITQLRRYFSQNNIKDTTVWQRVTDIIILTLLMQAPTAPTVTNCFELYGFDILFDESLKPWLLEVNFSPSLASDCQADVIAKKAMLHDLLDLISCSEYGLGVQGHGTPDPSIKLGRRGPRPHRDGRPGVSAASVQSDKTLLNRRGRRGGRVGGQVRQLSSHSEGPRQFSEHLPSHRTGLDTSNRVTAQDPVTEWKLGVESLYSPLTNGLTPNNSSHLLRNGNASPSLQSHYHENNNIHSRTGSFACVQDEDRETEEGCLTVRTEPIPHLQDSKTSLGSHFDTNTAQLEEFEESLHLNLHRPLYSQPSPAQDRLTGAAVPALYSSPKHSGLESLNAIVISPPDQGDLNFNRNVSVNFPQGKQSSLHSQSHPLLFKRPMIPSPDHSRSTTDAPRLGQGSAKNHFTSRSEKRSTATSLFRNNLQRGRERRDSQRGQNPGRNGVPPLCSIGRKKVGDFFLVFPFNEVSQGLSYGKLDVKLIIKEMQKQQKLADTGHIDNLDIGQHWGLKIWTPLKDTE